MEIKKGKKYEIVDQGRAFEVEVTDIDNEYVRFVTECGMVGIDSVKEFPMRLKQE